MNNTITKTIIGIVTVISGGAYVPIIPSELNPGLSEYPAVRAYQYPAGSDRSDYRFVATTTKKGDTTILQKVGMLPDSDFVDEDGNGLISVAVFTDKKGQNVYKKILDTQYTEMGKYNGSEKNPTATELVTIFESFLPTPADAAIAFSASSTGWVAAATSLTYSHTNAGSDRALAVGIYHFNGSGNVSGVTYNGVSMTQLGTVVADGSGGDVYLYGIANPATGANNIVISESASMQIFATSVSYTGVDQSTPFPDVAISSSVAGTTFSISTTNVTVDQSWVIMTGRSPSRVPAASAGTYLRKTNAVSGDAAWVLDSNGGRSTGANTLDYTYSPSATSYYVIANMAPAAAAPSITPNQNFILFE